MSNINEQIDFEIFYEKFDLEDFLLRPIGNFSKDDLKLIGEKITNFNILVILAKVIGLRKTMSSELKSIRNDSDWISKTRHISQEELVELFFRLYLIDCLKKWSKETE